MRRSVLVAAAAGAGLVVVGSASANTVIRYTMTGTIVADGSDSVGLNGATIMGQIDYDATQKYRSYRGWPCVPSIIGSELVTITGAPNDANNTTVPYNSQLAFLPTAAGTARYPWGGEGGDGSTPGFYLGSTGEGVMWLMSTIPTAGSEDVMIGGAVELDDFIPATGAGNDMLWIVATGESYTLTNLVIDAYKIPAPGALALLGTAGLVTRRRRRIRAA